MLLHSDQRLLDRNLRRAEVFDRSGHIGCLYSTASRRRAVLSQGDEAYPLDASVGVAAGVVKVSERLVSGKPFSASRPSAAYVKFTRHAVEVEAEGGVHDSVYARRCLPEVAGYLAE